MLVQILFGICDNYSRFLLKFTLNNMKEGFADRSNNMNKVGKKLFDPREYGVFKYCTLPGAISVLKIH